MHLLKKCRLLKKCKINQKALLIRIHSMTLPKLFENLNLNTKKCIRNLASTTVSTSPTSYRSHFHFLCILPLLI